MPRRHPAEFRRKVLDLVAEGMPVAEIARPISHSSARSVRGITAPAARFAQHRGLACWDTLDQALVDPSLSLPLAQFGLMHPKLPVRPTTDCPA